MQLEWRANQRLLRERAEAEVGAVLPGLTDEELSGLFAPLRPEEELVLGRRSHVARKRREDSAKRRWRDETEDALERGEGEGYLGDLFRERYDYIYDPDDHIFNIHEDYRSISTLFGKEEANRQGFVDAREAAGLIDKGLPATQPELEAPVHPRALARVAMAAHGAGGEDGGKDEDGEEPLVTIPPGAADLAEALGLARDDERA